jgi:hypothetical protein
LKRKREIEGLSVAELLIRAFYFQVCAVLLWSSMPEDVIMIAGHATRH